MNAVKTDKQDSSTEKNTELIERHEVKGTPFMIIKTEEGFFGVLGNYRITEVVDSKGVLEKELKTITWDRLVQVMLILIEKQK